ncbi:hypothetical protein LTR70_008284 [Exophiala xenobiotica]|uniref:Cupin type-1 domain-containing protein n=1 Tax=Lithohypha guttulata TaxID=1690604 RepID=A0ABR0K2C9_9EURO|nr:hypothetical protein LTR24_007854 [Lithohypha guttulata]KAK5312269.1 hypothetical protein LTR70_008284 [Exophiala xenobiotica]
MFILSTLLLSSLCAATPLNKRQIANEGLPGTPAPPVGASGQQYPTGTLLGPAQSIASISGAGPAATLPADSWSLVSNQDAPADEGLILNFEDAENPQPIRGESGNTDSGPRTYEYDRINPDLLARPVIDMGDMPNSKWPMVLSSNCAGTGQNSGWARQQNMDELPVSAVNQNGETFVDDLQAGDLWFFPAGVPHSIQATQEGVEFLLVFDQGSFSEDNTDLVTELFLRNPREVLAKNFQTDISTFDNLPQQQKYIFNGIPLDQSLEEALAAVNGPAGHVPRDQYYSYHASQQAPLEVPGGSVKIVDPTVFPIANNFSMGLFEIEPGAMREIHWHLTSDEWNFFIAGHARLTSFEGLTASRTFDFQAGDIGYVPATNSHYVENIGNETVIYIEILQAPKYVDLSAGQWLGLTPRQVVKDTLGLADDFADTLPRDKRYIVPGNADYTTTNFTVGSYPDANPSGTSEQKRKMRRGARKEEEAAAMGYRRNKAIAYD